jgi:subtilase family serine protease
MSNSRALVSLMTSGVLFCSLSYAVSPDRITGDLNSGQSVILQGNVPGFARPQFDLGRVDGNRIIPGVSLSFHPSAAQQTDLDDLLAHLQDPASTRFHKFLTPAQFANRYGMSGNDIARITEWLQSQGFTNISVANSRNQVSFDGTVAEIEATFHTEIHEYLVQGETHFANSLEPSVPAAMAESILAIGHLHNFAPRPRLVRPRLTSYISGNHYLTPADFATIYDLNPLYSGGINGTGQQIAVVGQSTVSTSDLNNFRSAAGLAASTVTMTLIEGTATRCAGDEGESDLDLEWSGGVAKNASITFLYAGLGSSDSCGPDRVDTVWDALQYAVDNNVAPFVSTSYGFCESGLGQPFVAQVQGWAQQGQAQGQTIVGPAGDSGAADCDPNSTDPNDTSATGGLAVDVPASIPEVTGAGGTMFSADSATCTTNCPPGGDPPYWAAAGATTDTVSSALEYIPETTWNETATSIADGGGMAATGGGASIYFPKPSWQTGNTGTMREVPDIALDTGVYHDPYLICSEDGPDDTIVSTCTAGFRTGTGGSFTAVGGTSAAAPTFSAILALVNQFFGNVPPGGLAPINPILYGFAATPPATGNPFHDITTGNNIVPCTSGTPDCPASAPFQYGFSAGPGYDEVTGLGSVDADLLAKAWTSTQPNIGLSGVPANVVAGHSTTTTVTVTAQNGFTSTVTFSCPNSGLPAGVTCSGFSPASVSGGSGSTMLTIQTLANIAGNTSITVYGTSGSLTHPATVSLTASPTDQSFTLKANNTSYQVTQGSNVTATVTLTGTNGFNTPVTYSCSDPASGSTCTGPSSAVNANTPASFQITAAGPIARLHRPADRAVRIFYAVLLPGLMGILLIPGSRRRSLRGMRVLGLIVVLGCSTLWMASCGGSNSGPQSGGTPPGTYTITVSATTGGANPVKGSTTFSLVVVP